eukprot:m.17840 g.17840  ORF g.17840 m.17840 type:complete len:341 (-) comp5228_c0_seq2:138-1160(-)
MGSHGSKQREEKAKEGQEKPMGAAMAPSTKYILVPVALLTFDPTRKGGEGEWVPRGPPQASPSPSAAAMPSGLPPGQSAVIVSFNVWFDSRAKRSRFSALLDEVLAQDPDCIGLQEMTPEAGQWLMADPRIRAKYTVTDPAIINRDAWYGVMSAVKTSTMLPDGEPGSCAYRSFGATGLSKLGRGLLDLTVAGGIAFGNVHLESPVGGVTAKHRLDQLDACTEALRLRAAPSSNWILVGDFNFISETESPNIPQCGGTDVWAELEPGNVGFTYDCVTNDNIDEGCGYRTRPDRITYAGGLRPTRIEMLGVQATAAADWKEGATHPSDHFGLVAAFEGTVC